MFFISWSGAGLLVPVIAFVSLLAGTSLKFLPDCGQQFVTGLLIAISLLAVGLPLRQRQVRRNLYWIPMEYWSIAGLAIAIMQLPHMFGIA
ncbi:MAG TPA: hypothetical protein V6C76_12095 [Drouetiella sp.]